MVCFISVTKILKKGKFCKTIDFYYICTIMKFRTYVLFWFLFGVVADTVIGLTILRGAPWWALAVYNQFWNFPGRYRLAIGEPFHIDTMPAEGLSSEWLHAQTDKIEAAVAALEGRF
jgi:hypothetical protein